MAFLCPLLLWGEEVGKSLAQPSLFSSPKLYTGCSGHPTKPPSPSAPWLLLWSCSG